ncbi:MAG TPA: hypothetical protein VEC57_00060 [Candidatus Limnocylindrales bacterium]|nr:hypothetical protein [Candidatus Limnocylindrales bacterium]
MTLEHRQADITAQLAQNNVRDLIANLARAFEERDALQAKITELEAKLAEATKPVI